MVKGKLKTMRPLVGEMKPLVASTHAIRKRGMAAGTVPPLGGGLFMPLSPKAPSEAALETHRNWPDYTAVTPLAAYDTHRQNRSALWLTQL